MNNPIFDLMQEQDYENIFFCQEKAFGLKAIIVIHNTTLGPAAGGCRMYPYETEAAAVKDALRLARGMTYKNAAAGLPFGGGKCVVIGDPKRDKSEGLLRTLGRFVNRLNGLFLTGVDMGTTIQDMDIMRQESPHVVTVSEALGGPGDNGTSTAFGVFQGIRACLKESFGSPLPKGHTIAVQGVGAVGRELVRLLVETEANVTIADVDQEQANQVAAQYHVEMVPPEEIYDLDVDVFSPCAIGGILNDQNLAKLHCKIVCGSANNQLAENRHGDMLARREILYAPDYIVSAGGVIAGLDSLSPHGYNRQRAMETVSRIYRTMGNLFTIAKEQGIPTYKAADVLAEQRIAMIQQVKHLTV